MGHRTCKHSVALLVPTLGECHCPLAKVQFRGTGMNVSCCTSSIWNFSSMSISTSLFSIYMFFSGVKYLGNFFFSTSTRSPKQWKAKKKPKHSKSCCREQHLEKQRHLNIRQIYVQCAKSWQGAWLRDGHKKAYEPEPPQADVQPARSVEMQYQNIGIWLKII